MHRVVPAAAPAVWTVRRSTLILTGVCGASGVLLLNVSQEAWPVVVPLVAIVSLAVSFFAHLFYRDAQLPIFDLGALTVLITAVYSAYPLFAFWMAGLRWTELSYLPLYVHNPTPVEVGEFAWRHVVYLYSLTTAYLLFRGHRAVQCGVVRELRPSAIAALICVSLVLVAYFAILQLFFGVSYDPSYGDLTAAAVAADALPLVVRQVSHNLFAILFLLKLCAVIWLMSRWTDWRWRCLLFAWLALEGIATVTHMGGRTWYVMLLMAATLLYHRMVRPLSAARALALAASLLGGVLVYGFARDIGGGLRTVAEAGTSPWATMNEFQALFGISYDLYVRSLGGTVGHIPWQLYATDIVSLIPSQFLPIAKADPCLGYPQVDGLGIGCVLGVVSFAVIGLEWIELLVRGFALGLLFAIIHRWYVQRQASYWATLFYLCLCLWAYYTFRGSTLSFAYYVVYRFVPLLISVRVTQILLETVRYGVVAARVCR